MTAIADYAQHGSMVLVGVRSGVRVNSEGGVGGYIIPRILDCSQTFKAKQYILPTS